MFYYKKGDIVTTDPWYRPSSETFNGWLKEWSKISYIKDYEVYLTGAFCENYFFNGNISTWDIDIFLKAKQKNNINYKNLKYILEEGIKIGFKRKLLVDIYCLGECPTNENFSYEKIVPFKEIVKKSETESWEWNCVGNITELTQGLYLIIKDPIEQYNKYISKNYNVPCKQITL